MGGQQTKLGFGGSRISLYRLQLVVRRANMDFWSSTDTINILHHDSIKSAANIILFRSIYRRIRPIFIALDVGCFAVLKRSYGRLVKNQIRLGTNHINKLDFLVAFPQARIEAFKSKNIQNSFIGAGLVPYNLDRVLSQLNIQPKTPTPPGSRSSAWSLQTPLNPT